MAASIITSVKGDVTYDGIPETVSLIGVQFGDSNAWQQMSLVIQNGATGQITAIALPEDAAYAPSIALVSLTGKDKRVILLSLPTGGSGGITNYIIYTCDDRAFRQIFSSDDYNAAYPYQIQYLDGYAVKAASQLNRQEYFIDLTGKGSDYLNQLYNADGSLREPMEGFVNPLSGLYPIDVDGDGPSSLLAWQRIAGLYNADSLGYFLNTLDWQGGTFVLTDQMVGILGTES